jgi:hypothetical protein
MAKVQPAPQVQDELLLVISSWRKTIIALQDRDEKQLLPMTDVLSFAIALDTAKDDTLTEDQLRIKQVFTETLYGKEVIKRLESLLTSDQHLKATCLTPWGLGKALDRLVFNGIGGSQMSENVSGISDESILSYSIGRLFEASYSRTAVIHLYNLSLDQPVIEFPDMNARILKLAETDIPLVTGESTFFSTLHYPNTGNYFLMYQDTGYGDDWNWLSKEWEEAWVFVRVLKYLRYGIIDTDYGGIFFTPTWVNEVRKYGIYILGRPRWDTQAKVHHLTQPDLEKLRVYLRAVKDLHEKLFDFSSELRRGIGIAGDYYEFHHTRTKMEDQLVELVIALEALFSPQHEGELRYRISQGTAIILGADGKTRKDIFQFVRRMYDARSRLVHGGTSPIEDGTVKGEDIAQVGDYVRQAILRFLTLYARGETKRNAVLEEISLAILDPEKAVGLRDKSDLDKYLKEVGFG